MRWVRPLTADLDEGIETIGGKAHGLVTMRRLGLPVPPGFVLVTEVCRRFLRDGRLPQGLDAEVTAAIADLEAATTRTFGGRDRPLAVSVRSGGVVSMPGMMSTVLDVGLTTTATAALAAETGSTRFAHDCRRRFLAGLAAAAPRDRPLPDDPMAQLSLAIATVLASWDTPRARVYRTVHAIPHGLGTAVVVQAMVYGNRDGRSGTGVAFGRDPGTGARGAVGEFLVGAQGDDVVSGRSRTRPLGSLADREPGVWADLDQALTRLETHERETCSVEFTVEAGRLWLLQLRAGGLSGAAAVRVAVDLADEGLIGRDEAVRRITEPHLRHARLPRLAPDDGADVLARGLAASPGVATGRVTTTPDAAVRLAATEPAILVRPETSPLDMPGIAAAAGLVTARGGPASHAAVVARSMGRPAVVGVVDLAVDGAGLDIGGRPVDAAGRRVDAGTLVTVDGTLGLVVLGRARTTTPVNPSVERLLAWADAISGETSSRPDADRLAAAHAALRLP